MERGDLRVSDADRQQVAEQLQRAVGDGYITLPEFEERTGAAFAAMTRGELDAVVSDIPNAKESASPVVEPSKVVEIRGTGSDLKRNGAWQVPAALRVRSRFSTTVLDFTEAVITSSVVDIEIDDKASSIKLIVPESATVDCDGLEVSWGDLRSSVSGGPPRGHPHLVVHGRAQAGDVKIRHSRKGSWWDSWLGR